jgi:hypothetical protein
MQDAPFFFLALARAGALVLIEFGADLPDGLGNQAILAVQRAVKRGKPQSFC